MSSETTGRERRAPAPAPGACPGRMDRRSIGHNRPMASTTERRAASRAVHETRRHGPKAAVWGLVARGVLYLLLGYTALQVVVNHASEQIDSRGALHQFAGSGLGSFLLVLLGIGFLALALWNIVDAFNAGSRAEDETGRRIADAARAVVYLTLTVATISVVVAGGGSNTDRKSKTWTATVLGWSGG